MIKKVAKLLFLCTLRGLVRGHVLMYGQSVLYTWDDPTTEQELACSIMEDESSETKIKLDAVITINGIFKSYCHVLYVAPHLSRHITSFKRCFNVGITF